MALSCHSPFPSGRRTRAEKNLEEAFQDDENLINAFFEDYYHPAHGHRFGA
jgi:hypothetical protein